MKLENILNKLSKKRDVFHSEADFQHALAWEIRNNYPNCSIRLEYPMRIKNKIYYVDIYLKNDDEIVFIELKYKTRKIHYLKNQEEYLLKNQGAQDCGRYDYLWDIFRLEDIKRSNKVNGYAIFLTNDSLYWKVPQTKNTVDSMFRIHEGAKLYGELDWSIEASMGTKKGRENRIILENKYIFSWKKYSELELQNGKYSTFKYLFLEV